MLEAEGRLSFALPNIFSLGYGFRPFSVLREEAVHPNGVEPLRFSMRLEGGQAFRWDCAGRTPNVRNHFGSVKTYKRRWVFFFEFNSEGPV